MLKLISVENLIINKISNAEKQKKVYLNKQVFNKYNKKI